MQRRDELLRLHPFAAPDPAIDAGVAAERANALLAAGDANPDEVAQLLQQAVKLARAIERSDPRRAAALDLVERTCLRALDEGVDARPMIDRLGRVYSGDEPERLHQAAVGKVVNCLRKLTLPKPNEGHRARMMLQTQRSFVAWAAAHPLDVHPNGRSTYLEVLALACERLPEDLRPREAVVHASLRLDPEPHDTCRLGKRAAWPYPDWLVAGRDAQRPAFLQRLLGAGDLLSGEPADVPAEADEEETVDIHMPDVFDPLNQPLVSLEPVPRGIGPATPTGYFLSFGTRPIR